MMDFKPTETPLGIPVCTTFEVCGHVFVVDVYGTLFQVRTEGEDPDLWCWIIVQQL